jgi:hypothetical protein
MTEIDEGNENINEEINNEEDSDDVDNLLSKVTELYIKKTVDGDFKENFYSRPTVRKLANDTYNQAEKTDKLALEEYKKRSLFNEKIIYKEHDIDEVARLQGNILNTFYVPVRKKKGKALKYLKKSGDNGDKNSQTYIYQTFYNITLSTTLHKNDFVNLMRLSMDRDLPLRTIIRDAITQYVSDSIIYNKMREEAIKSYAHSEVLSEIEKALIKRIELKNILWRPRYGKKGEDLKKSFEDIEKQVNKEVGAPDDLEDYEKEEKEKMVERIKNKDLWKPKYKKVPPALKTSKNKNNDEELEKDLDKGSTIDINTIKTIGVLPEELGIEVDDNIESDLNNAPTEEEMKA